MNKPRQLKTLSISNETYYVDERLQEFRLVSNGDKPIEFIPFMSTQGQIMLSIYRKINK